MTRAKRSVLAVLGAMLIVPIALTLTVQDASATGYALEYARDGGIACNPGGTSDCPQS